MFIANASELGAKAKVTAVFKINPVKEKVVRDKHEKSVGYQTHQKSKKYFAMRRRLGTNHFIF